MDELVTDLTIALERTDDPQSSKSDTTIGTKDSPSSTPVRKRKKRRGRKRRSDFPLTKDLAILSEESNDSIEEALKDYIENISMCQSDSDEDSALTSCKRLSMFYRLASKSDPYPLPERLETDPVNETATSSVSKRRNKKMKRTKQQSTFGAFQNNTDFSINNCKSKVPRRSLKRKLSNRYSGNACGETWTRRSKYEEGALYEIDSGRSLISEHPLSDSCRHSKNVHFMPTSLEHTLDINVLPWQLDDNPIDEVMACSDSESSSGNESEGFFTNDEGRLGDDEGEESTFEQDGSSVNMQSVIPWWENENESEELDDDQKFNNIIDGVMDAYGISVDSNSTKGGFQARLNSIKYMHETNGMKPLVETNRKISKFLHDPLKSELSVPLTNRNEREKIYQLASLYSLHCRTENLAGGRIILIKTRNTCQADKKELNSLLWKDGKRKGFQASEVKRAKRMEKTPEVPGLVGNSASAIPEHNIGNQMLRSMGWVPGTGLGPDKGGIVEPISATLRPRKLGLGHSWPAN